MASTKDLRMVLLGKSGSGKSSTGNTILGREVFKVELSPHSVTMKSEKHEGFIEGRRISVTDTPGTFNTSLTDEELKAEINRCIYMSAPGPHVFLLVIRLGVRFTEEEWNNVRWIQENFGEEALKKFTVVLFLGEQKRTSVDFLNHCSELEEYISNISHKHFILAKNNHSQIPKLMQLIDDTLVRNGDQHYDNSIYREIKEKLEKHKREKEKETDKQNMYRKRDTRAVIITCGMVLKLMWTATHDYLNTPN